MVVNFVSIGGGGAGNIHDIHTHRQAYVHTYGQTDRQTERDKLVP